MAGVRENWPSHLSRGMQLLLLTVGTLDNRSPFRLSDSSFVIQDLAGPLIIAKESMEDHVPEAWASGRIKLEEIDFFRQPERLYDNSVVMLRWIVCDCYFSSTFSKKLTPLLLIDTTGQTTRLYGPLLLHIFHINMNFYYQDNYTKTCLENCREKSRVSRLSSTMHMHLVSLQGKLLLLEFVIVPGTVRPESTTPPAVMKQAVVIPPYIPADVMHLASVSHALGAHMMAVMNARERSLVSDLLNAC